MDSPPLETWLEPAIAPLDSWATTTAEAKEIQEAGRDQVITQDQFCGVDDIKMIAGVDVGFEDKGAIARAAVALLDFQSLEPLGVAIARVPTPFPYIPGFLSFREIPAIVRALAKLTHQFPEPPDVIICDGQGYAHPRRFGLACHLGVLLDRPTLGAAKSRFIGEHVPLGEKKGDREWLGDRGETIGVVLRTRDDVRPLYISSGHRIGLESAVDIVLRCTPKYRLPETTRWADKIASQRGSDESYAHLICEPSSST
ncbi:MAG: deoxyribonuclease V [Cyanobacteria bacterium P01_C01_bin.89]